MPAVLALLLVLLTGCAGVQPVQGPSVANYVYRLGSGDRLRITTYGEDRLSGEFPVAGDGSLGFPLVGNVPAAGRTLEEFRADLVRRLGGEYVRNPQVTVEIANFRPVFILGEVARPGEYSYSDRLTVLALIAKAGGFTYRANTSVAFVSQSSDTAERAYHLSSELAVQPGDVIRIGERYF
jgi:protein involved in polysaccharide export with SLBB domain